MARILLASDKATNFNQLLSANHEVRVAHSAVGCVQVLPEYRPELLIVDQDLPWGGANEVLVCLRERLRSTIPVIVLAGPEPSTPVVEVLPKPVRGERLLRAIDEAIPERHPAPTR
jgi:DNA-binding response OmpR family regulator